MLTDAQRLAAVLALLRARVASGDVRACVLRECEAVALSAVREEDNAADGLESDT